MRLESREMSALGGAPAARRLVPCLGWGPRARRGALAALALAGVLGASGCDPETVGANTGHVTVAVAPLSLPGLTDANYQLTVTNAALETVWTRAVTSTQYGDGAGSVSYVGACDPTSNPNTVSLAVLGLSDANGALTAGVDFANPAPIDDPLSIDVLCVPDGDTAAAFELTVARAARQGFFDVAITFDDIFCSAKLDCLDGADPLELLFDPLTGQRAQTAVMGFACTAGPDQDTHLWMDQVVVTCGLEAPYTRYTVNPALGPGNLNPAYPGPPPNVADLLFQAATYRGVELLDDTTDWSKAYWNVALGLNGDAFPALGDCTLDATATASSHAFDAGQTPINVRWPTVTWHVPLVTAGALSCGSHQLDDGTGVRTTYTPSTGHGFFASYQAATGVVSMIVGAPDASSLIVCDEAALTTGAAMSCTLGARADGNPILTQPTAFALSASPGGTLSNLSPATGLSDTFTFTFTAPATPGLVTLDSGVGATTTVTIVAPPDATSTVACAPAVVPTGGTATCTITPKNAGTPTPAPAGAFSPSASPTGSVSAVSPAFGDALTFTFTAGATSGPVTVASGLGAPTTVTVVATPDATALLTCANAELYPGSQTVCALYPRAGGVPIYAAAADITVAVSPDGAVSAVSPAVGTALSFIFTAPGTLGPKTISVAGGPNTSVLVISIFDIETLTLPGPPTIIDGAGQDQQIALRYAAPAQTGGSTNLVYTTTCTSTDVPATSTGAAVTPSLDAVVTGLTNGLGYTCVVYASNELGDGPPSAPTQVLLPGAITFEDSSAVARPVAFRNNYVRDPTTGRTLTTLTTSPAVFAATCGADVAASGEARAALSVTFWSSGDVDLPSVPATPALTEMAGPIALPAVFAATSGADLAAPTEAAIAPVVTSWNGGRYVIAADNGATAQTPLVALPTAFAATSSAELAAVEDVALAPVVTTWNGGRYAIAADNTATTALTPTALPAAFAVTFGGDPTAFGALPVVPRPTTFLARPFVTDVPTLSVAQGTTVELALTGVGFTHASEVRLYDPTGTLAQTVPFAALTVDPGGSALTATVTLDLVAPLGTWTAAVATLADALSPTTTPPAGATWDNRFVVTSP